MGCTSAAPSTMTQTEVMLLIRNKTWTELKKCVFLHVCLVSSGILLRHARQCCPDVLCVVFLFSRAKNHPSGLGDLKVHPVPLGGQAALTSSGCTVSHPTQLGAPPVMGHPQLSGQHCQVLAILEVQYFLLISDPNLPSFSLTLSAHVKRLSPPMCPTTWLLPPSFVSSAA